MNMYYFQMCPDCKLCFIQWFVCRNNVSSYK